MQNVTDKMFDGLVEQFLGKRLPEGLAASVGMLEFSDEAKDFTLRALSLLKRSGYSVTELNQDLIHGSHREGGPETGRICKISYGISGSYISLPCCLCNLEVKIDPHYLGGAK